jgi:hypothetical protein
VLIKTKKLLTVNRIDVIFKILHLKLKALGAEQISKKIYDEHIFYITNGLYIEEGSSKKSLKNYTDEFNSLFKSLKDNGFDSSISKIPLSCKGCISNGSHRLAASIFLKIPEVRIVETIDKQHLYNFNFFKERGISKELLELAILEFLHLTENNHLAIIWPSANKKINYINKFSEIIYEKKLILNPRAAQNFVAEVYKEHKWVGSFEDGYGGAITKVSEVFDNYSCLHLIFFKENSLKRVKQIKNLLRDKFNIGKSSVHITDNTFETREIGNIILNNNSIHFMKYGIPNKFSSIFKNLKLFRERLNKMKIDINSLIISNDTVLGIYGIKSSETVQYLSVNKLNFHNENFHNEISNIAYYDEKVEELIYDPKNYFYFSGFKFSTLDVIEKFKIKRKSPEDYIDLKLIQKLNSSKKFNIKIHLLDSIQKYKFKLIGKIIPISKKFKFYHIAKKIYKFLNSKLKF